MADLVKTFILILICSCSYGQQQDQLVAVDVTSLAVEVAYHGAIIDANKDFMVPESDNRELQGLSDEIVPTLEMHLGYSQMDRDKQGKR